MKNITLRAPEQKIDRARRLARERRTTLNRLFVEWLDQLEGGERRAGHLENLFHRLDGRCSSGGSFTREEMNER